jgi:hypothetical protein
MASMSKSTPTTVMIPVLLKSQNMCSSGKAANLERQRRASCSATLRSLQASDGGIGCRGASPLLYESRGSDTPAQARRGPIDDDDANCVATALK